MVDHSFFVFAVLLYGFLALIFSYVEVVSVPSALCFNFFFSVYGQLRLLVMSL